MCIVAQKSQFKIPILGDAGTNPAKVTSVSAGEGMHQAKISIDVDLAFRAGVSVFRGLPTVIHNLLIT